MAQWLICQTSWCTLCACQEEQWRKRPASSCLSELTFIGVDTDTHIDMTILKGLLPEHDSNVERLKQGNEKMSALGGSQEWKQWRESGLQVAKHGLEMPVAWGSLGMFNPAHISPKAHYCCLKSLNNF